MRRLWLYPCIALLLTQLAWCSIASIDAANATGPSAPIAAPESSIPPTPIAPPTPICPQNCSGNGVCDTSSAICACFASWAGPGCQYAIQPLSLGVSVNGTIVVIPSQTGGSGWNFWSINIATGNFLKATLTLNSPGALNFYASFVSVPSFNSYWAATQITSGSNVLTYTEPNYGVWNFGVASNANCSYSISVASVWTCANNCSGNGVCNTKTGACQCNEGYTSRPDCSLALYTADSTPQQGILPAVSWIYYAYESGGNDMTAFVSVQWVTQPKQAPQLTPSFVAFLRYDTLPSALVYNQTCASLSIPGNCTIKVTSPAAGLYYLGLTAPSTLNYTVLFTSQTLCPNQCSGIGTCQSNGICKCPAYYGNADCSRFSRPLTANAGPSAPISINATQAHYFTYQSQGRSNDMALSINHTQTVPPVALAIFASCGGIPTEFQYDRFVTCELQESSCILTLLKAPACMWTFALATKPALSHKLAHNASVYQDIWTTSPLETFAPLVSTISYTVALATSVQCPNDCSNHGSCQPTGTCLCDANYASLADCSRYLLTMINGMTQSGVTVSPGKWKYFSLQANLDNYLSFTITNLVGGNIDAYLANNVIPTMLNYHKTIIRGNQPTYQLSATAAAVQLNGTWTLGIFGDDNVSTTFSVTSHVDRDCPDACFGNGYCSATGQCICKQGYVTSDCSALSVLLPANLEVQGTVRFDTWSYYNLTVLGDDALEIIVQENNNWIVGMVWVFVARGRVPTKEDHDYSNQTETTTLHTISIPSGETRGLWMIGVTGSPRATGSSYLRQARYNLFALSGCGTYTSCGTCVLDPNCGWCRNQPFDPDSGLCVPGNDQTSLNQTCLFYQYSTCSLGDDMSSALTKGLVIGVAVGLIILIAALLSAFLVYRYYKHWEKSGLKPVHLYPEESIRFGGSSPPNGKDAEGSGAINTGSQPSGISSLTPVVDDYISSSYAEPSAAHAGPHLGTYGTLPPGPVLHEGEQGVYYSFGGGHTYTDSETETGQYEDDSDMDS